MNEHHILPPLVRGKCKGFVNFFIDEVKIFKNTCNFEKCEVVVRVQWWGDPSPALIRPKEFLLCQKKMKYLCQKTYYHCANYELKTDLTLFQNYLRACEVLELAVLEVFKNIFIGSAFLNNLVKIIGQSNDQFVFPIVDYLGETIGEMKIHTDFVVKNPESNVNNSLVERQNLIEESDVPCKKNSFLREKEKVLQEKNCNKIQESSFSPLTSERLQNYGDLDDKPESFKSSTNKLQPKNKEFENSFLTNETIKLSLSNSLSSKSFETHNQLTSQIIVHNFPQVEVHSDFSKVLSFPIKRGSLNCNLNKPKLKFSHCNRTTKNHVSVIGKSITQSLSNIKSDRSSCRKKISNNKSQICKKPETSVVKNHSKEKVMEHEHENPKQLSIPRVSPISLPSSVTSDRSASLPESKSLKVSCEQDKKKILDYLLGFDMNKEEEHIALNNFKKMSPSRNFVETVSELFATRESQNLDSPSSEKHSENEKAKKTVKTFKNLKFDFDDPIEKKYYETFFAKEKSSIDFKIVNILNQPQKTDATSKEEETLGKTSMISDTFQEEKEEGETKKSYDDFEELNLIGITSRESLSNFQNSDNCPRKSVNDTSKKNKCGKCKYYKKLDELDTIIESLKNFEKSILNREKKTNSLKFE